MARNQEPDVEVRAGSGQTGSSGWLGDAAGAVASAAGAVVGTATDAVASAAGAVGSAVDAAGDAVDSVTPEWLDDAAKFVAAPMLIATEAVVAGATSLAAKTGIDALESLNDTVQREFNETLDLYKIHVSVGASVGGAIAGGQLAGLGAQLGGVLGGGAPAAELPPMPEAPAAPAAEAAPAAASSWLDKLIAWLRDLFDGQ